MAYEDQVAQRADKYKGMLDRLRIDLERDFAGEQHRAGRSRSADVYFRFLTALLGVIAPALVTYQTTQNNQYWGLAAVLVTGLVGALATLQASFRWGERYCQTQLAAHALDELKSSVIQTLDHAEVVDDPAERLIHLKNEYERASAERRRIRKQLMEAEVSLVRQLSQGSGQAPVTAKAEA